MTRLVLGEAVTCVDGSFGELEDVVIDSAINRVTHLVVQRDPLPGEPGSFQSGSRPAPDHRSHAARS